MDYPGKVITKNQVTPTQSSAPGVWTLDDAASAVKNNNWPVAGVPNPISKSLRFNSADSAYLNRTPASATNRRTWTWSGWVKRAAFGTTQGLFARNDGSVASYFIWNSNNKLEFASASAGTEAQVITTPVYRDASAWYHVMCVLDTTQATSSNRVKLYVNGSQVTALDTATYPSQNYDTYVNTVATHYIGNGNPGGTLGWYSNQYLTEINFIDGQALTPSSFGMTDPQTGAWIPIKYTGTYGTNGFYLNFKDATSTSALGYDYSGNSNNWTTNNFSVTAGSGNDSLTDVPTPWFAYNTTGDVGGVFRGNYCTLNPLSLKSGLNLANGNLAFSNTGNTNRSAFGTTGMTSGKWYCEVKYSSINLNAIPGVVYDDGELSAVSYIGNRANGYGYESSGSKYNNGSGSAYGASWTTANTIGIALDLDAGTLVFYKDGVSQGTAFSSLPSGKTWFFGFDSYGNGAGGDVNFGQRPFAYTPPAGFRSLCTTNLPTPTIGATSTTTADKYFNANLYTGTGSAFTLTGVGFQPDFGWFKGRNASSSHWFHDVVRGANPGLSSNSTAAEDTTAGQLTAFASDGYSLPNDTAGYLNFSGRTMVVWSWKAGGSNATNTSGTITSTVRANTTAGFSVVTYTGTGSNATVGHGLGAVPSMIIVKRRDTGASGWSVYFTTLAAGNILSLQSTAASTSSPTRFTTTLPTSTVFSIGTDSDLNANGGTYVAYCFAAVAGYSAFGSYTGNGSSDGPFVYTGFRPRWILIKNSSATASWYVYDAVRNTFNVVDKLLYPNLSNVEDTYTFGDMLSNGFKIRSTDSGMNGNGNTIIYAAFAESPFKFALAR